MLPDGAGFYYIPGTDTCIKLGGYIRADMGINTNLMFAGNTAGIAGAQNRLNNAFTWRSCADLNIDTRTATEYGVVRTYLETVFTWTSGGYIGAGTGATIYDAAAPIGSGAVSGGQLGVYYAFIQFAGFTMGKPPLRSYIRGETILATTSSTVWSAAAERSRALTSSPIPRSSATAYLARSACRIRSSITRPAIPTLGVAPTATFGTANFGYGSNDYGGTTVPDIIGQLRVDQAWGMFQASVAAHNNNPAYYTDQTSGGPGDKWGWLVSSL